MATRLPRAKVEVAFGDRDREGASEHAALHVCGHVIIALVCVHPWRLRPLHVQIESRARRVVGLHFFWAHITKPTTRNPDGQCAHVLPSGTCHCTAQWGPLPLCNPQGSNLWDKGWGQHLYLNPGLMMSNERVNKPADLTPWVKAVPDIKYPSPTTVKPRVPSRGGTAYSPQP